MLRFIPSFIRLPLPNGTFVIDNVPFFSQQMDRQNYLTEGFHTFNQVHYWQYRMSPIVCLKMAIAYYGQKIYTLRELIDYGIYINAYREDIGWIHRGLVQIARHYGIRASRMSLGGHINHIARHIMQHHLVMASVAGGFEWGNAGQLVVVFGVKVENHQVSHFLVHHSGPVPERELPEHWVSREQFLQSFSKAGNIIVLAKEAG
ncbi:MAG: hypothetical protein KBB55_00005 [Candidatus Buchananbacteria bacterium]|nr:hypothetical protein [Candidatus Buchananbacteria bacterium]